MASITLRPTSASGSNWSNIGNAYDGNESTNASVSVSLFSSPRTLTLNFDTSVIPSGATINSATLTLRSKANKNTITARADINGSSQQGVINQKQSTKVTNYTADVASYISNLTSVEVSVINNNWSGNTFELYELWIDVDYTEPTSTTYTVRFLDWDNSEIDIQTVEEGGSATPPPNPTRDGYTFSGWSGNYTNVTADVDIIAQYTQNSSGGDDTSVKNIKIGNSTIDKLYLGTSQIVKVYLGNVLIFGGSSSGDSGGSGGEKNHSVQLDTVANPSSGTLGIDLEDTLTFSWDMSSIPSNATITKTTLMFDMTFNNFKAGSNELILEMRNYELGIAEDILGKDSGATRSFTYDCTSLGSNNSVVLDLTGYSISSFTYTISSARYIVEYTV